VRAFARLVSAIYRALFTPAAALGANSAAGLVRRVALLYLTALLYIGHALEGASERASDSRER
jgi:hypothetical protein